MARTVPNIEGKGPCWLPKPFGLEGPYSVSHSTSCCIPWVLGGVTFGFRAGIERFPFSGVAGFLYQLKVPSQDLFLLLPLEALPQLV